MTYVPRNPNTYSDPSLGITLPLVSTKQEAEKYVKSRAHDDIGALSIINNAAQRDELSGDNERARSASLILQVTNKQLDEINQTLNKYRTFRRNENFRKLIYFIIAIIITFVALKFVMPYAYNEINTGMN